MQMPLERVLFYKRAIQAANADQPREDGVHEFQQLG
jgi:hypothetical protein